jgi:hypothetical protein
MVETPSLMPPFAADDASAPPSWIDARNLARQQQYLARQQAALRAAQVSDVSENACWCSSGVKYLTSYAGV